MTIAEKLCQNLDLKKINKSKTGSLLIFNQNYIAEQFEDFFGIEKNINFEEAFNIVTTGQGNEMKKINSIHSSSLLSLLFFYPLYNNKNNDIFIQFHDIFDLKDIKFTKCLFEVRNKVIRRPSCIDIVLISEDEKVLLYLESKLSEYMTVESEQKYGKGYLKLYKKFNELNLLSPIKLDNEKEEKTILKCDEPSYIEGIKQSISHLIGLVKGPTNENEKDPNADEYVLNEYNYYKNLYNQKDIKIFYNTIIYNPEVLGLENETNKFESYLKLYQEIIGKNHNKILEIIRTIFKKYDKKKNISIIDNPFTYNSMINQGFVSPSYNNILSNTKIKGFYKL